MRRECQSLTRPEMDEVRSRTAWPVRINASIEAEIVE